MPIVRASFLGALAGAVGGLGVCYGLGVIFGLVNVITNSHPMSISEGVKAGLFFIGFRIGLPYGTLVGGFIGFVLGTIIGFNGLVEDGEQDAPR